ncbi:MAG: hypothetical protein P8101_09070, partial [Candidatus Thiodiazotropha sp.]
MIAAFRIVVHLLCALILIGFPPWCASAGTPPPDRSTDQAVPADTPTQDREDTLIIAGSRNLPPFSQQDGAGRPTGIGEDIWELWARRNGYNIRFQLSELMNSIE